MTKTIASKDIERAVIGYMLNAPISKENQHKIVALQEELTKKFGAVIWNQPPKSLHITLFDWLAPLVEYDGNKEELFNQIYSEYDHVVTSALENIAPIQVAFDNVGASPSAVFLTGHDDGQFAAIRQSFLDNVQLLPRTKLPPKIIHSTVGRFTEAVELEPLQAYLAASNISFTQTISSFRLVKETLDPMLEFKTIKEYKLY